MKHRIRRSFVLALALAGLLVGVMGVSAQSSGVTYIVRHGDTLTRIAAHFGTTVQAIARANGIVNLNLIFAGQALFIPVPPRPACGSTYVVQRGDTLAMIAAHCNTTVSALAAANGIVNVNLIFAGQVLVIPPPPPPPVQLITYVVQPGDTLTRIALRFNTTIDAILLYNPLPNPNRIRRGQRLAVPVYYG